MELKPCKCGAMPIKETKRVMLGRIEDGGYPVMQGRFKCEKCGFEPNWGIFYCVDYGWDKNIEVWNCCVDRVGEGEKE